MRAFYGGQIKEEHRGEYSLVIANGEQERKRCRYRGDRICEGE